jgi:multiple sugar transport system permease protein
MSLRRSERQAATGFLLPFVLLYLFVFVLPIGYAVYQSLLKTERSGLGLGAAGKAETVFGGLDNYRLALDKPEFIDGMVRVLLFAVAEVPLMIGSATVLALLLDSASARAVPLFRSSYFLPYGVPGVIASILWGFLYVPNVSPIVEVLGHVGLHLDPLGSGTATFWSIANIVTWEFAGYNMLILVAQLKAIDGELYEAGRIDGANAWHEIRHIKLPLIRPAIVLTTVFTIIGTLQLFAEPFVLKGKSTSIDSSYTPNLAAYTQAFTNNNQHLAAAQAVILAVATSLLSFGFLRVVGRKDDR